MDVPAGGGRGVLVHRDVWVSWVWLSPEVEEVLVLGPVTNKLPNHSRPNCLHVQNRRGWAIEFYSFKKSDSL